MNSKNKLILGMFSLAFASLAGLQGVNKYLNYTQSSVLGDETNLSENFTGGKANFFTCENNSECASLYCDLNAKRCIPKPTNAPTATIQEEIALPNSTLQSVPCSEYKKLNGTSVNYKKLLEQYCK